MRKDNAYERNTVNLKELAQIAATGDAKSETIPVNADVVLAPLPAKAATAHTAVLPNVSEAAGKFVSVHAVLDENEHAAAGAGASVVVKVGADSLTQGTNGVLATYRAAGDYGLFYCDGMGWFELATKETPAG